MESAYDDYLWRSSWFQRPGTNLGLRQKVVRGTSFLGDSWNVLRSCSGFLVTFGVGFAGSVLITIRDSKVWLSSSVVLSYKLWV